MGLFNTTTTADCFLYSIITTETVLLWDQNGLVLLNFYNPHSWVCLIVVRVCLLNNTNKFTNNSLTLFIISFFFLLQQFLLLVKRIKKSQKFINIISYLLSRTHDLLVSNKFYWLSNNKKYVAITPKNNFTGLTMLWLLMYWMGCVLNVIEG